MRATTMERYGLISRLSGSKSAKRQSAAVLSSIPRVDEGVSQYRSPESFPVVA